MGRKTITTRPAAGGDVESLCRTPKLFTSTDFSNLPMQSLLNRTGFALGGVIYNLDDSDTHFKT